MMKGDGKDTGMVLTTGAMPVVSQMVLHYSVVLETKVEQYKCL
jgi:hypothetical protein